MLGSLPNDGEEVGRCALPTLSGLLPEDRSDRFGHLVDLLLSAKLHRYPSSHPFEVIDELDSVLYVSFFYELLFAQPFVESPAQRQHQRQACAIGLQLRPDIPKFGGKPRVPAFFGMGVDEPFESLPGLLRETHLGMQPAKGLYILRPWQKVLLSRQKSAVT